MTRPNILFITADQWRGDCLSALGHPFVQTPTLDALAADGVLFERHYANCAPCAPSRATLHTGLYQKNHRVCGNGTPLDRRHTNWALELRKAGYDPQLIGYTDQTPDPRTTHAADPVLRNYEGLLPGLFPIAMWGEDPGPWADHLRRNGFPVPTPAALVLLARPDGPDWEDGAPHPKPASYSKELSDTAFAVDTAIQFIHRAQGPWALHLSLLRPHPPWIAPEPYNRLFDPADMPAPIRLDDGDAEGSLHPWLAHQLSRLAYRASSNHKKQQRFKAVYYALMREVDDQLAKLLKTLQEIGQDENTVIVFTSDHGEQMGDHWLLGKGGFHEASYHVPLIIKDPRTPATQRGKKIKVFTEHVDIAPTLLDSAGTQDSTTLGRAKPKPSDYGPAQAATARGGPH